MSRSDVRMEQSPGAVSGEETEKKRKRSTAVDSNEELEIDINLPEPPSKKARRKEKKDKSKKTKPSDTENAAGEPVNTSTATDDAAASKPAPRKGDFGIWIGNLPFSATPDKIREFLLDKGDIDEKDISRINMPGFSEDKANARKNAGAIAPKTPQNKGFAYIDFTTKEIQDKAISLSETLLVGRPVLIKDAKSFAGRPKAKEGSTAKSGDKEPSTKVFVGNLGFDVTKQDLTELLGQAGRIADCFLATFEDSGKCKGFGWVRFGSIETAQAVVRGWFYRDEDTVEADESGENESSNKAKSNHRQRVYINKLHGRALRCEFAEDSQTRYKKRFGKDAPPKSAGTEQEEGIVEVTDEPTAPSAGRPRRKESAEKRDRNMSKDQRRDERRKRDDARTIAPGKALAQTARASAAIVEGAGKKISFED